MTAAPVTWKYYRQPRLINTSPSFSSILPGVEWISRVNYTMSTVLLFCICASLLLLHLVRRTTATSLPLPPGPSIPRIIYEWIQGKNDIVQTFQAWNKRYGPIVYARVGAKRFIILGSRQAAQDLLEKRAAIYSSRGPSLFLDKYLHQGLASAFMPYGTQWRLHRRLHANLLSIKASKSYESLQELRSGRLMHGFLNSNRYCDIFYHYTSSIMYTLAYGGGENDTLDNEKSHHGRLHQINEMATFILQNASYGTILLDTFPFLDRLSPRLCMEWRERARELHHQTKNVYIECGNTAIESKGLWNWSCEANNQRGKGGHTELTWEEMCYSIGELYVAGIHTTKMVLEMFVEVCLQNPEAVNKAQAELDSVVGPRRLPSFTDKDNCPCINAFISELLRRHPISPFGVPHMVTQDDEYMGYRIPAGTIVVANQMGINMDETIFENPEKFESDRYMQNVDLPHPATFGFGRRQCPGHHVARANLFIVISRVLWGYDILQYEQAGADHTSATSAEKAIFVVRSDEHRRTIENTAVEGK